MKQIMEHILNWDVWCEVFNFLDWDEYYQIATVFDLPMNFKRYNISNGILTKLEIDLVLQSALVSKPLELIQYLLTIGRKCTKYSINLASMNGHLEVVQYLHQKGEICNEDAMNWASSNGHLDVVKYLRHIGKTSSLIGMNNAMIYGHLDVVKYLHGIGQEYSPYAVNCTIYYRRYAIIQFLMDKQKLITTDGSI
jgi:hypothetical protein